MKVRWPRTLFARLMLIWLVGIAMVLGISFILFLGERDRHDSDMMFEGIAREAAAAVDILNQLSPSEREKWVETLGRRSIRIGLHAPPHNIRPLPERFGLTQAFKRALPNYEVGVYVQSGGGYRHMQNHPESRDHPFDRLLAVVTLSDGHPVLIRIPSSILPLRGENGPASPGRVLAALLALIIGITLLAWIAVRLATRPLSQLAKAAHALGEDPNTAPLTTGGPLEVSQAAIAFNQMQQRIREHVGERTRILAAISHDLQTPITRLMLRAEMIDDETLRSRVQSDLEAMQALVKEGLDYARSLDASAPMQVIDLNSLVDAMIEDARDMGWRVDCEGRLDAPCVGQIVALRRAIWNLIENGVKFGGRVAITLQSHGVMQRIVVRDFGPGLPAEELEKVFEPFYRTEASRNRETGGTGLGLAIARNLLQAQGGSIHLANAPDGGLVATVDLPTARAEIC